MKGRFDGANTDSQTTAISDREPLPRTGREVKAFLEKAISLDDLNDSSKGSFLSKNKRNAHDVYQKLVDGRIDTPNGGFVFQDKRDKNDAYMKYNDMPSYKDVMKQVIPQMTPENLRQVKPSGVGSSYDGESNLKMWVYETFVANNTGERVRTYVKVLPFHSDSGKPYAILVSLHRTGPINNVATRAQRG